MTPLSDPSFAPRYGPWAVMLGGSEGIGAAFARQIATRGVNVVLVARRPQPMEQLAAELTREHRIVTRTLSVDLQESAAAVRVFEATADLEVGLLVYNAGADARGQFFVDVPVEEWVGRVECNCVNLLRACHHFGSCMRERQRGGIVIISSGAAWAGGARIAVYAATKGFDLLLGESLWAEMEPCGVDVLSMVLGVTDTPAFRRHLVRDGIDPDSVDMADPEEVAAAALANLGNGPTWIAEGVSPDGPADQITRARRERVSATSEMTAKLYAIQE
jgi:uncharacterized protein